MNPRASIKRRLRSRLPCPVPTVRPGEALLVYGGSFDSEIVTTANGTNFTLEELQGHVEGYITYAPSPFRSHRVVVNEDGLHLGLPFNPIATVLAIQPLVGNVLFCPKGRLK